MNTTPDQRSGIAPENIQEVLDAGNSVKAATQTGQQQYPTPTLWAEFFASQLPSTSPTCVFDPQCAGGNLLLSGWGWSTEAFGWDIDARFEEESLTGSGSNITRLTANCVALWDILDDLFPELRFECQVANPPFGLRWKKAKGEMLKAEPERRVPAWLKAASETVDSTEYTWKKILERASRGGYGYFIANSATIERLKIHEHPDVFLYQRFPAGFFPGTVVEPGVVHWKKSRIANPAICLVYTTLDPKEHAYELDLSLPKAEKHYRDVDASSDFEITEAFNTIKEILHEERVARPPFNIWLDDQGMLRIYLSTRTRIKRKLSRDDIERLSTVENQHPLTLTTEAETRKLLKELTTEHAEGSFYTISPEAKQAIAAALAEVATLAVPLLPVSSFEKVAYCDEMEALLCNPSSAKTPRLNPSETLDSWLDGPPIAAGPTLAFTPGNWYPLRTATYTFVQKFKREKVHFNEETEETYTQTHECSLSGQDRYIALTDDNGIEHRFMDRPEATKPGEQRRRHCPLEHEESLLWEIFEAPEVRTIAESKPEQIAANLALLKQIEERINQA